MSKMVFINLPVRDLAKSTIFYQALGASKNDQFSDDTASSMVFSDAIYAMLLTHDKYSQFTSKPIADARKTSQVLIAITAESRAEVDAVLDRAKGAGGAVDPRPAQDHGFMYSRSFDDPDGHTWEVVWMDVEQATASQG
ncbi:hypothetical protein MesoLjLc_62140 [Mesorhizobium sp. L-8-10]|uniref:VOC family protein n=1 Tax=unclassified Mesorhizobium TaxID=325217 RepID=UPI001928291D|nr:MULTISPECIES: VOC family protein [unclassified Mesorhizobium]BCH26296.1 hypothetical protein MesoLjLb_60810 [Mesorhizobium sp. L-8-3]BCH34284.1 hypothetical protein MesoLjLc_62140 [Mesorhizobium sp. L-8-10]